tara:strand:- start:22661 stop:24547 length:1887 start_codon:yes stop_codon:yes gene_type:complete
VNGTELILPEANDQQRSGWFLSAWRRRLGARILAVLLIAFTLFAVTSSYYSHSHEEQAIRADLLARGRSLANQASLVCPDSVIMSDWVMLSQYVEELVRGERVAAFAAVERSDGTVVASYPADVTLQDSTDILLVSVPILVERAGAQLGTFHLGLSLIPARAALRDRIYSMLWQTSLGFLFAGLILWLVLRTIVVRPIARLDAAAQRLGEGSLQSRIPDFGQTELGRLGRTLEVMRHNLNESHASLEAKNQRLLELGQIKNQFLANVSHEMRTPLTTILGRIELLTDSSIGEEERAASLAAMERNGHKLFELVDQLLDLAKLESGELLIDTRPCEARRTVHNACDRWREQAAGKGLQLEVDTTGLGDHRVTTDPVRIQQVLGCILDNAIKFSSRGTIGVDATLLAGEPQRLQIIITDHGEGFDPTSFLQAASAFQQADGSLTRRHGGLGIGLFLAQQITRRLGGDIAIDSAIGKGATVTITVEAPEAVTNKPAPVANKICVKGRVLVVDDAPDNQRLLRAILTRFGLTVELAENGRVAIERMQASLSDEPFDFVLMDLQMPEVDGITAIRELRSLGFQLPIVSLTANALDYDRERCMSAGATGYETKPITRQRLGELVTLHVPASSHN